MCFPLLWLVFSLSPVFQTGIVVTLAFSVTATAILSDLWSKEWKTLLLSLQVSQSWHASQLILWLHAYMCLYCVYTNCNFSCMFDLNIWDCAGIFANPLAFSVILFLFSFFFKVTAPFLHVAAVLLMAILSWPIALHFYRMNKRGKQVKCGRTPCKNV